MATTAKTKTRRSRGKVTRKERSLGEKALFGVFGVMETVGERLASFAHGRREQMEPTKPVKQRKVS